MLRSASCRTVHKRSPIYENGSHEVLLRLVLIRRLIHQRSPNQFALRRCKEQAKPI
jgi:hypothetical protein